MVVRGIAVLIAFPVAALFSGVDPHVFDIKVQSSEKYVGKGVSSLSYEGGVANFLAAEVSEPDLSAEPAAKEKAPVNDDKGETVEPTDDGSYEIKNQIFDAQTPSGSGSIERLTLPVVTLLVGVVLFFVAKVNPGKKTTA